jgi:hypothetical protein
MGLLFLLEVFVFCVRAIETMNIFINMKCWDIMNCTNLDCTARSEPENSCWEIANRIEAFQNVSHTCRDCIVHLLKEETSVLSKKESQNIIRQRVLLKNIGANHQVCVMKNATSG